MAVTPRIVTAEIDLPLYTRFGDGELIEVGTTRVEVPIRISVGGEASEPAPAAEAGEIDLVAAAKLLVAQVKLDIEQSRYWQSREAHTSDLTLTRQWLESYIDWAEGRPTTPRRDHA